MDVSTYGTAGSVSVTAQTSDGDFPYLVSTPAGGSSFIGLTLAPGETLTDFQFSEGDSSPNNFIFDNIAFGNQGASAGSSVPDAASTFALLGLAAGLLAVVRAKR